MKILTLDPSGNFSKNEGDGTTGWAIFEDGELKDFGDVGAVNHDKIETYWEAISDLIDLSVNLVVCESYRLFAGKASAQSNSMMETPQLIGYLRMHCFKWEIPIVFQDPKDKLRVTDPILVRQGVFVLKGRKHYCQDRPTNLHMRDAIRHGLYFLKYGKVKDICGAHIVTLESSSESK
jgi:hypothetical protein